jgi:hypothetical protein
MATFMMPPSGNGRVHTSESEMTDEVGGDSNQGGGKLRA